MSEKPSIYDYQIGMSDIKSDILEHVLSEVAKFEHEEYGSNADNYAISSDKNQTKFTPNIDKNALYESKFNSNADKNAFSNSKSSAKFSYQADYISKNADKNTLSSDKNQSKFTPNDVKIALGKDRLEIRDLKALLSEVAEPFLESIAQKAIGATLAHFGNAKSLFTPLYLSNFCESKCVYCGFQKGNAIVRARLTEREIHAEMEEIAKSGLGEILLLTGEGRAHASVSYLARACAIARQYFRVVGVEVYVMNADEYAILHDAGCDFVTIYQETYNASKYAKIHAYGEKRCFPYRFNAQERAILGGMRGVGFGALLGIDDFRKDALATALHAHFLQQKYPHAELSLSAPRLRPILGNRKISPKDVTERRLLQVLCAYRLFLPYANITISTREAAKFRDNALKIAATKISAGVNVGVGGHLKQKGDEQFEISDSRSVREVMDALQSANLQAVMGDQIYVG